MGQRKQQRHHCEFPLSNGLTIQFNQTDTFWAGGGGTPAYDPTKQCVYWDATARDGNTWTLDACSTPRPYICQKHRYDQNSPPTSLDSSTALFLLLVIEFRPSPGRNVVRQHLDQRASWYK